MDTSTNTEAPEIAAATEAKNPETKLVTSTDLQTALAPFLVKLEDLGKGVKELSKTIAEHTGMVLDSHAELKTAITKIPRTNGREAVPKSGELNANRILTHHPNPEPKK